RRRHTRFSRDWSSDVCSSDLPRRHAGGTPPPAPRVCALCRTPAAGAPARTARTRADDGGLYVLNAPASGAMRAMILAAGRGERIDRKSVVEGKGVTDGHRSVA